MRSTSILCQIIALVLILHVDTAAQYVPNKEFNWARINFCLCDSKVKFSDVVRSPVVRPTVAIDPDTLIAELQSELGDDIEQFESDGIIKIDLYLFKNKKICVQRIGLKGLLFLPRTYGRLERIIERYELKSPGVHNDTYVDSQDWLYIHVREGMISDVYFRLTSIKK